MESKPETQQFKQKSDFIWPIILPIYGKGVIKSNN